MEPPRGDWVSIAHLTRTRGNRGELCAIPLTSQPERYQLLKNVQVGGRSYGVERVWYHKEQPVFKLKGVDSISDAEQLAGMDVCIPAADRMRLQEGEYFLSDLVESWLVDHSTSSRIGKVTGWQETGTVRSGESVVLLEVDDGRPGEPLLVPFARSILKKIDPAVREIRVELPPGLRELKR
jgi:16S rRNA processing protein RimM